jgi:hypothetical protein
MAYARAVTEGSILTNHLVGLACERHLEDLSSAAARGLRFDTPAAQHAIDFFGFLRHSKGEWAGQTFELAPWQGFVVGCLFGWKRSDGLRRFRTAYCAVPRKNGKSTLSAGIGLYLLVADGEHGAEIHSAATSRDQARIVFDEAKRMVGSSPALKRRVGAHLEGRGLGVHAGLAKADDCVGTTGDDPHRDRLAAGRRVHGIDPERGECRVHRVLERCHQVRLPLISTRGLVQIGSGLDCTCSMTQRANCWSTAASARRSDRDGVTARRATLSPWCRGWCGFSGL